MIELGRTALAWAQAATHPPQAREAWRHRKTATLNLGELFDAVHMEIELALLVEADLQRRHMCPGPLLLCGAAHSAWWFIDVNTGTTLNQLDGATIYSTGHTLHIPPPGRYYVDDRTWLNPPQNPQHRACADHLHHSVTTVYPRWRRRLLTNGRT